MADHDRNEDRRKNDEAFKLRIIEQQAEIKSLITSSASRIDSLAKDIGNQAMAISNLQFVLWGGPKESDVGLLEKHRRLNRNWTIAIGIVAFVASLVGKAISPVFTKLAEDYMYNSPSHRYLAEKRQPKRTVYRIYQNPEPKE